MNAAESARFIIEDNPHGVLFTSTLLIDQKTGLRYPFPGVKWAEQGREALTCPEADVWAALLQHLPVPDGPRFEVVDRTDDAPAFLVDHYLARRYPFFDEIEAEIGQEMIETGHETAWTLGYVPMKGKTA